MRENPVKQRLKNGENCIGTMVRTHDPTVVEVLGYAGFDFIIIDTEHMAMNDQSLVNLIRAADLAGMPGIMRVRTKTTGEILRALDMGACGVIVPQIESAEEAQAVVQAARFAPLGSRGYANSTRAAQYGFLDGQEYARLSNEHTLIIIYCETLGALREIDEILALAEVDMIFLGPNDLAQALGVLGQPDHPKVRDAMETVTRKARAAGKAVGTVAADAARARLLMAAGIQFIALSSDLAMIAAQARQHLRAARSAE
jgi:4-hydroxy-2-oxoheptanedioate aldolase